MSDKKNSVPIIRFKEFQDNNVWEQYKLIELIDTEFKGRAKAEMVGRESLYLDAYYLNSGEPSYVDSPADVNEDDVLILWDGSQAGTVYHGFKGALGSTLKAYNPKYSGSFLYYYLVKNQRKIFDQYRTPNIPHVTKTFTEEFIMCIPSMEEQAKIGFFFKQLDQLITLQQRKLKKLQNIKKAYLNEMFPTDGELIPRRRFARFYDDWEQCKIGDILEINSGRNYKHLSEGNIPVYGTGGYMCGVNDMLSDVDAIGIGRKGTINKPQLLKAPFWTVDTLFFMTIKERTSLLFCYFLAINIPWKKFDESTSVPSLSKTNIDEITITIPSLDEQIKIGNFFKQLDELITLQQQKIKKLQNIKKAYLNEMFI